MRDRFSGAVLVYPQSERNEQANYESLRHFAGKYLSGKKGVLFVSDNAKELTGAASRLGWIPDPSVPGFWPYNANCEREVRAFKELARPAHVAAGFTGSCGHCLLTSQRKQGHFSDSVRCCVMSAAWKSLS